MARYGIPVERYPHRPPEIQADTLEEVARHSLEQLLRVVKRPVFVEDAGLFIRSLSGFPGPYSSYVLHTIGNPGILKLMEGVTDRAAAFRSVVAYAAPEQPCLLFTGETLGHITHEIRGTHWGFDPIFVPAEGDGRTYAEMGDEEKNRLSHRAKALAKLASFLLGQTTR